MKKSIQDQIRKLLAVKNPEPTALYEPAPMENESAVESITPKGGVLRGAEPCIWTAPIGDLRIDYTFYNGQTPGCTLCSTNPQPFCECIRAYHNVCYRTRHGTNGQPDTPPIYSWPAGCPSIEEMDSPGYTVEEWVGNTETLSGQRYIWGNWEWIARVQRPDGSFDLNDALAGIQYPFNCSPDPVTNPDYDPLNPDSFCYIYPGTGERRTMREVYDFWYREDPSHVGIIPTLRERRMMEMGCYGVPFVRSTGSCCTFDDFGGAQCRVVSSSSACDGVFTANANCSGDNPCGGLDQNPIQQNDQAKNQKQAIDMVMSILKRK